MMHVGSSSSLNAVLTTTAYFIVVLSTCCTKKCELHLTEKMKRGSVVCKNVVMKFCKAECFQDSFIFASCRWSSEASIMTEDKDGSSERTENPPTVLSKPCGSKVCSMTSQCLENGCGNVCVEAQSLCDLHTASKTGDLSRVKSLLSHGRADVNCQEWIGRTPVMWAAGEKHEEVVKLLVSKGANMSLLDRFDMNILHSACLGGDVEVVKYVLSQNMLDINGRVQCGRTAVMLAAENGHKDVVELLVGKGADMSLVDETDDNVLHCACRGGDVELVKYVLSQSNVDINSRGWIKRTPMMAAAERGHTEVVKLLVSRGADVSLVDTVGENVLHWACVGGHVQTVMYILSQSNVDINSSGWKKRTPMMAAAERGHTEVVKLLVSRGADVSLVDTVGENVLHWACVGGHVQTVMYILSQSNVDINSRGWKKRTPMMAAAERGHTEVVKLLVSRGADVSLVDTVGNNILHYACQGGNVEVVRFVVSQNIVDINCRGMQNMTSVMVAAKYGRKDVVEFLVSRGAESPSFPSKEEEWKAEAAGFPNRWSFHSCLGVLDGKHVVIRAPSGSGSVFCNYKGFHSLIFMALVDSQYRFLYVELMIETLWLTEMRNDWKLTLTDIPEVAQRSQWKLQAPMASHHNPFAVGCSPVSIEDGSLEVEGTGSV
ncbi:ankyrin repeat domain-containing protein 50-like [Haliotis asinina]|uniref:ankyrin repeat domain-containing protein 50-like n=1 Tax=Haliotis asinina TaxID=109174 RepID=UPI003532447D